MNCTSLTADSLGSPVIRTAGTLVGAAAFCAFSRTWQDIWHVVYDIPAALAVYSFLAQVLAEGMARQINRWWWVRLVAIVFMTVITVGRVLRLWPVSGHVTTVLAVAIIQLCDARLPRSLRLTYWAPLPILIAVRLLSFDRGFAPALWLALLAGTTIGIGTIGVGCLPQMRCRSREGDSAE